MIRVFLTCMALALFVASPPFFAGSVAHAATVMACQDATGADWPVSPQHPCPMDGGAGGVPPGTSGATAQPVQGVTGGVPVPTIDANGAAFQGVVVITPGTPVAAARSIGYILTTPCTETLTLADASTIALALQVSTSFQSLPFAVTNVSASGCIGTFWNLK